MIVPDPPPTLRPLAGSRYSLELGKRVALGGGIAITPQLQTVYSEVRFDRFTDPTGADVSLGKADSLKTRWGIAIEHRNDAGRVYAVGNLTYDWLGDTVTDVSGAPIARTDHRLWGELGLGGNVGLNDRLTLYGEATPNSAINDFGKSYGLKAMAGVSSSSGCSRRWQAWSAYRVRCFSHTGSKG